jgi:hypothetical protein
MGLRWPHPHNRTVGRCRCRLKPRLMLQSRGRLVRIEEGHYKPEFAKLVNGFCSGAGPGAANGG